ncbi:hypothetical protein [Sphingobium tyrosinilyticum]|uniref:Lipoprotein n=1 Tax=Sphingobium tyrosinilyticum TaxID=2715436 RepID=A0ABV9F289_9SPHN
MQSTTNFPRRAGLTLLLAIALAACGKIKPNAEPEADRERVEAKRQKAACTSPGAYNRLKDLLFDQVIEQYKGHKANLDTLADYSSARMEDPVVEGSDPLLDITRCKGRFILDIPPGAERAFAGDRRLQADVRYTAQAAADGSGFVYQLSQAEPLVTRLAGFNLDSGGYRPPPAIDEQSGLGNETVAEGRLAEQNSKLALAQLPASARNQNNVHRVQPDRVEARKAVLPPENEQLRSRPADEAGETAVRAFYNALSAGDGAAASARVIAEKRRTGAFSPQAISRFYGALPDPIRLTKIVPLGRGAYRVRYRYSAGRSHCDGSALVSLTDSGFIRSIKALNGC